MARPKEITGNVVTKVSPKVAAKKQASKAKPKKPSTWQTTVLDVNRKFKTERKGLNGAVKTVRTFAGEIGLSPKRKRFLDAVVNKRQVETPDGKNPAYIVLQEVVQFYKDKTGKLTTNTSPWAVMVALYKLEQKGAI